MENKELSILLITHKFCLNQINNFLVNHSQDKIQILASDYAIYDWLSLNDLESQTIYDFINDKTEKEIYNNSLLEIINKYPSADKYSDDIKNFLRDCKTDFLISTAETYLGFCYLSYVVKKISPKKIYFFSGSNIYNRILKQINHYLQIEIKELPLNLSNKILLFLLAYLPYLGWEKAHYHPLINKLRLNWLRLLPSKIKLFFNQDKPGNILIGPFLYRNDITEFTPLINLLKNQPSYQPIALIDSQLNQKHYHIFRYYKIPYIFLYTKYTNNKNNINWSEISLSYNNKFLRELFLNYNWNDKYISWLKIKQTIKNILKNKKYDLLICVNQFSSISKILLDTAKAQDIKTISTSSTSSQLNQLTLPAPINIKYLNDFISDQNTIFISQKLTDNYQKIFNDPINNKNFNIAGSLKFINWHEKTIKYKTANDNYRFNFIKKWHLPKESKFIIFTTQQQDYSFDYPKILIAALEKMSHLSDYYLIIKIHPLEFKWLYKLMLLSIRNKKIIITKNDNLYDLIMTSEFLVTYYSFTAIESLMLNKPVLFLNMNHKSNGYKIIENKLAYKIDKASDIPNAIDKIISDKKSSTIILDDSNSINNFINNNQSTLDNYLKIIDKIKNQN